MAQASVWIAIASAVVLVTNCSRAERSAQTCGGKMFRRKIDHVYAAREDGVNEVSGSAQDVSCGRAPTSTVSSSSVEARMYGEKDAVVMPA